MDDLRGNYITKVNYPFYFLNAEESNNQNPHPRTVISDRKTISFSKSANPKDAIISISNLKWNEQNVNNVVNKSTDDRQVHSQWLEENWFTCH